MKPVAYSLTALRSLRRHGNMATRLKKAIEDYGADQAVHANNVTQMVGSTGKRMRVGDFRILFEETEAAIVVTDVGPRGGVYGGD